MKNVFDVQIPIQHRDFCLQVIKDRTLYVHGSDKAAVCVFSKQEENHSIPILAYTFSTHVPRLCSKSLLEFILLLCGYIHINLGLLVRWHSLLNERIERNLCWIPSNVQMESGDLDKLLHKDIAIGWLSMSYI